MGCACVWVCAMQIFHIFFREHLRYWSHTKCMPLHIRVWRERAKHIFNDLLFRNLFGRIVVAPIRLISCGFFIWTWIIFCLLFFHFIWFWRSNKEVMKMEQWQLEKHCICSTHIAFDAKIATFIEPWKSTSNSRDDSISIAIRKFALVEIQRKLRGIKIRFNDFSFLPNFQCVMAAFISPIKIKWC